MSALYGLFLRLISTRARIIGLAAFGVLAVTNAAVARGTVAGDPGIGLQLVDIYGVTLLAPINALVFASAALGDLVDDNTLVYLWLRPVSRWRIVAAALTATLTVALPLVLIPTLAVAVLLGDARLVGAAVAGAALATFSYAAIFLGLGLRIRRSLAWGFAYLLIWEGAVARVSRGAARLSVQAYSRTVLWRVDHGEPPRLGSSMAVAVIAPLVIAVVALALAVRWLRRAEVA